MLQLLRCCGVEAGLAAQAKKNIPPAHPERRAGVAALASLEMSRGTALVLGDEYSIVDLAEAPHACISCLGMN